MKESLFDFNPSQWVPFKDKKEIERVLKIKREDIEKHSNPEFKIRVVPDADIEFIWIVDMLRRIKHSSETGEKLVMILPNPAPTYRQLARLINACNIDCSNIFNCCTN